MLNHIGIGRIGSGLFERLLFGDAQLSSLSFCVRRSDINSGTCSCLFLSYLVAKILLTSKEGMYRGFLLALSFQGNIGDCCAESMYGKISLRLFVVFLLYLSIAGKMSMLLFTMLGMMAVSYVESIQLIIIDILPISGEFHLADFVYPVCQQSMLYLLSLFLQRSLTFGEALLVSLVACMFLADFLFICYSGVVVSLPSFSVDPKLALSYGLVWGMVLIGLLLSPLLRYSWIHESSAASDTKTHQVHVISTRVSICFGLGTFCIVAFILEPLMYHLIGYEPFLWTISFISDISSNRPYVIVYWIGLVGIAIWQVALATLFNLTDSH